VDFLGGGGGMFVYHFYVRPYFTEQRLKNLRLVMTSKETLMTQFQNNHRSIGKSIPETQEKIRKP
jgi:hypothetical protein